MAIKLEDKKAIVAEVNEAAKAALSAVVADARGVTVGAMTGLRKEAREAGVYVRVVRNTLLKRAVEGTQYDVLNDAFVGPTLIAFSKEHPGCRSYFQRVRKGSGKVRDQGSCVRGQVPRSKRDRRVGFAANSRRSYCEADERDSRRYQQAGSYSGGYSRPERSCCCLRHCKPFQNHMFNLMAA